MKTTRPPNNSASKSDRTQYDAGYKTWPKRSHRTPKMRFPLAHEIRGLVSSQENPSERMAAHSNEVFAIRNVVDIYITYLAGAIMAWTYPSNPSSVSKTKPPKNISSLVQIEQSRKIKRTLDPINNLFRTNNSQVSHDGAFTSFQLFPLLFPLHLALNQAESWPWDCQLGQPEQPRPLEACEAAKPRWRLSRLAVWAPCSPRKAGLARELAWLIR